ncbi:hypothetical protein [Streptomyces caatingaensis]|uniref:Integral membrane protein n=1 Tax=Streptomyces caatingaensis TaxID=1678637 RepID=A0A0K9XIY6_9ACTN|nr:hypothetical protein [Streptomyces caatingaensis]KNB53253.1 hypothetical protein AC230_07370 [Streptomyces caatingaensis]
MTTRQEVRWAGLAGVIAFPALVLSVLASHDFPHLFPNWGSSTDRIVDYFARNSGLYLAQCYVGFFAYPLTLFFIAGLTAVLRRAGRPTVSLLAITPAMTVVVVLHTLATVLWVMASAGAGYHHTFDDSLIRFSFEASLFVWLPAQPFVSLTAFCTGMAIRRTRALPRWTAAYSFATAALGLPHVFFLFVDRGWFAPGEGPSLALFGLFYLWTAVLGLAMLRLPAGSRSGDEGT